MYNKISDKLILKMKTSVDSAPANFTALQICSTSSLQSRQAQTVRDGAFSHQLGYVAQVKQIKIAVLFKKFSFGNW